MEVKDEDWSGSVFERVRWNGSRFVNGGMVDIEIRGAAMHRARLIGVELRDVEISGDIENVMINGVDVAPLVEAELDRRDPARALMRADDAATLRAAWRVLLERWAATMARAEPLPEALLQEQVNGEWSFIQTLRHLGFATAEWLDVMILDRPNPWRPLDLPWDEAPPRVITALREVGILPEARDRPVSLAEARVGREARQAAMTRYLETVTDDDLRRTVQRSHDLAFVHAPLPVAECLRIILNEEYQHHCFATRDLDSLLERAARRPATI